MGLHLPDHTVSRYSDTNPLDVVWELYDICVNRNNPDEIDELLVVAGRGSGKCQIKGTKILREDGVANIEDIQVGDLIYTGWGWSKVKETFDEGVKLGLKVKTKSKTKETPFECTGTPHHRIQAVSDCGTIDWVHLEDLKENQWLYKSANYLKVNTNSDDYSDGWLIGAIAGDGNIHIRKNKANRVSFCSEDFKSLRHYAELVYEKTGRKQKVIRNSKKSVVLALESTEFIKWIKEHLDGELCYDKQLITLNHSFDFLAGFVSGMMDTDGHKEGIGLTNKVLIEQLGKILNIFGVSVAINNNRRKPRYSKIANKTVTYHEVSFKSKLPNELMPKFSKYPFIKAHMSKMNEQYRYPNELLLPFVDTIKNKLKANNGWLEINGDKIRKAVPFAKELFGQLNKNSEFIGQHKLEALRDFFQELLMPKEVEQLSFILNGYFEQVDEVVPGDYYFYDLEMDDEKHAYWSNGFISHNTLGMAIAELLIMLHDRRDVVHVGAILSQAKRCYDYQIKFMLNKQMQDVLNANLDGTGSILEKANMEKSIFNLGGDGERTTLEILPCTLKAVNGPHVPLVVVDEIDTVSGEGFKAFKDISGMLDSRGGQRALRVGISTRKTRYGLMNEQIENAAAAGRTVKRWTALEFAERCPDSRSGTDKTIAYVNQDDAEVLSEDEYNKKHKSKQQEYFMTELPGSGCMKCPMASLCLGDAKNQVSTSPMLKPITDPIKKVMENGPEWAISQLFNLKPSVEGIIYKEFDERLHVKDWNAMWETLTGVKYPGECTHDIFVRKCHQMKVPCYAGIDWGWSNPSTVVYFFVDNRENIYVVRAEGMTYTSNPTWIQTIKAKWHQMYKCQLYFPDLANPGDGFEMRKAGLPCPSAVDKSVESGIQTVKKWLKPFGQPTPKLFISKENCEPLINEFSLYHFKTDAADNITDTPNKKHDHWLDALRYGIFDLFGKSSVLITTDLTIEEESVYKRDSGFSRTPSAAEFAAAQGLTFNSDVDTGKLGRVGTLSELEEEEEEDQGGFFWSF